MKWRKWTVVFEGRVLDEVTRRRQREILGEVIVWARDRVEAQRLAFQRAPSAVLRPTDVSSGALWSYAL